LAALRIHSELKRLHDPAYDVRVGIHSGEVVLRHVTHDFSSVYDAVGAVVHVAKKIEEKAPPGGTLISSECLALNGGRVETKRYEGPGLDRLRGEVVLFELLGIKPISKWQAKVATGLSEFVGRGLEIQLLRDIASRVAEGRSQTVAIEGDPGAGKSRVGHQFLTYLRGAGWQAIEVDGEVTARQMPWGIVRRLLHSIGDAMRAPHRDEFEWLCASASLTTEEEHSALRSLLGLIVESVSWANASPEHRRYSMVDTFVRVVLKLSDTSDKPIVLLIEDQQWLDTESADALAQLATAGTTSRLLLMFTRRGAINGKASTPVAHVIHLPPLTPIETRSLLDHLLGTDPQLEAVKQRIIVHTGGTPLFVEEVVRRLADIGALAGVPGSYRVGHPVFAIGIPPRVQDVISARINQVSGAARDALQIASVLGGLFSLDDVASVANESTEAIRSLFVALSRAAFVVVASREVEAYRFAHDLVREVTYGSMMRERRRVLHLRALDVLTSDERESASRAIEELHRHAVCAEDWVRAVAYARRAAAHAIEQSGYSGALAFIETALDGLARLEPSRANTELEIDLRLEARPALATTGELVRFLTYAKEAEAKARAINDPRRALTAGLHKAHALAFVGTPAEAIATAEEMLGFALKARMPQIELVARYILAQSNYTAGKFRVAADVIVETRNQLSEKEKHDRIGTTGTTLVLFDVMEATARASMGEFDAANRLWAAAIGLARETGRPYDRITSAYGEIFTELQQGHVDKVIAVGEPALALVRKWEIPFFFALIGNCLGSAYAITGRCAESVSLLQEAREIADKVGHAAARLIASINLGFGLMGLGRTTEAEDIVRAALENSRQGGFNGIRAIAARVLAEIANKRGCRIDDIEGLFSESIEAATLSEARPNVALGHFSIARFRLERGQREAAWGPLETAMRAFRQMEMGRALEEAAALEHKFGQGTD